MSTTTQTLTGNGPTHRLASLSGTVLIVLLAGLLLCATALAATSIVTPSGSSCSGSSNAGPHCANTTTIADEAQQDEEESEERDDEEVGVSPEAGAEEAGSNQGSPSNRAPGQSSSNPQTGGAGSRRSTVVLSRLKLTARTTAALRHRRPSASTVGFSFTLSAPAEVRVTLVKQTTSGGHKRWTISDSLTLSANKGRIQSRLTGHNELAPGNYRLTVKPTKGNSHSIYLSAHR